MITLPLRAAGALLPLLAVLGAAPGAAAEYPPYQPQAALTGDLRITCESSAEPLMKLWVERFARFHPGFEIIAKGTSPIASVPMVMSGAYEIGFPARELWPAEEESFRKIRGYEATVIMVGLGAHRTVGLTPALGVFVNAGNPLERITLDQLDAIYSAERRRGYGKEIRTWGDLGLTGEWAGRPIEAYAHRLPNGIDYFIQKTVTKGADFKPSVIQLPMRRGKLGPDELIAEAAAGHPAAIGFGCFGSQRPGMKVIALAGTAAGPYRRGTLEEVKSLEYVLARPIYMVIDREPGAPLASKIAEFLTFVLSREGQEAVAASDGWLPLPPDLAAAERQKMK
ncbi:MAG: PstS family phosphate ABC transporter substrate-binding protein [Opitutales bacterium]